MQGCDIEWYNHSLQLNDERYTIPMQVTNLRNIYRLLALLTVSFAGGFLGAVLFGAFNAVTVSTLGDAVSIANTYIVFTTIIFVGFTVVLGVAGYVFTQQFSTSKETQIEHLIKELEERLRDEQDFGISFIEKVLDNKDVIRHANAKFEAKISQIIKDKYKQAQEEASALAGLAGKIEE